MAVRLYGYFGHGNLGDEALCTAWRRAVPRLVRARVVAPPWFPRGPGTTLFCGGILQDRTSLRSLLFYAAAVRYAASRGPCALAAVGVDVHSAWGRRALRSAVGVAGFISGRDTPSCRAIAAAGGTPREARDVALTLPAPARRCGGPVLVNLTHAVAPDERACVRALALRAGGFLDADVRGVVLARGEDEVALRGFALVRPDTPETFMELLAGARLVIAARLHALELALLCGVPFVLVEAAEKTRAFIELVERELPAPVPRVPGPAIPGWLMSSQWSRALGRARERLVGEAWEGVRDVSRWLDRVA